MDCNALDTVLTWTSVSKGRKELRLEDVLLLQSNEYQHNNLMLGRVRSFCFSIDLSFFHASMVVYISSSLATHVENGNHSFFSLSLTSNGSGR